MKRLLFHIFFAAVFTLNPGNLRAQDEGLAGQTFLAAPKKAVVEQNMQLGESESASFWRVYEDYEIAQDQVYQKLETLIHFYAQRFRALTDAEADKMLQDYLAIEKEKIAVREQFVPRFKEVLSSRQVARLYQIENKFDAVVRLGLAEEIPLVRTASSETENLSKA